ncbi:hypothetical protein [Tomitella cavernea]|nr:hypothetical protein [Tomitella cavernea]
MAECEGGPAAWSPEARQRAARILVRLNTELGKEITPRIRWIAEGGEVQAAGAAAPAEPAAPSGESG